MAYAAMVRNGISLSLVRPRHTSEVAQTRPEQPRRIHSVAIVPAGEHLASRFGTEASSEKRFAGAAGGLFSNPAIGSILFRDAPDEFRAGQGLSRRLRT